MYSDKGSRSLLKSDLPRMRTYEHNQTNMLWCERVDGALQAHNAAGHLGLFGNRDCSCSLLVRHECKLSEEVAWTEARTNFRAIFRALDLSTVDD
eukprot:1820679-Prymnesium_polylepis.2